MHFTLEAPNMHRKLHQLKVEMVTYQIPTAMEQGKPTSAHVFDEEHVTEDGADAVCSSRSGARTRRSSGR